MDVGRVAAVARVVVYQCTKSLHSGTGGGISATFRISLTFTQLSETHFALFEIAQRP